MATTVPTPQIQFVTLAIGATAKQMGISATELYNRLNRHNLVRRLLIDCYDTLHTESIVDRCLRFITTEQVQQKGGML